MDSLDALDNSLSTLEEVLLPLLDMPLTKTLENLELMQKAKLQVLLPYVVHDLVFIYLKTRGINPKTHPVVGELDRIKQYFDKIKNAEDPEKRRFAVDQGAATRFIKHAIKESQATQEQAQRESNQGTHIRFTATSTTAGPSQDTTTIPRATEAALAKIRAREATSQAQSSSEESELEVFDEAVHTEPTDEITTKPRGKGKEKIVPEASTRKKRRRGMDPWAGYDEESSEAPNPEEKRSRKKSKLRDPATAGMEGGLKTPNSESTNADRETELRNNERSEHEQSILQNGPSGNISRGKEVLEIIDVDASSEEASNQTSSNSHTVQIIDVDAIDQSRPETPTQEKKKKRKKKKRAVT